MHSRSLQVLPPAPSYPHQPSPSAASRPPGSQRTRDISQPPTGISMCCSHLCDRSFGLLALSHTANSARTHIRGARSLLSLTRHASRVTFRHQVLYTELQAARARSDGNGGAFVSAMALLAVAAAASAADASGLVCR